MAFIRPVSDLRNYNTVLEKTEIMRRLMCELNDGRRSVEEKGYLYSDDVREYFHRKRL